MKCDSQASLLARTFVSPCLGHEPKVRVMTSLVLHDELNNWTMILKVHLNKFPKVLSKHNLGHHSNENTFFGQMFALFI
jgi:hypothetical protein